MARPQGLPTAGAGGGDEDAWQGTVTVVDKDHSEGHKTEVGPPPCAVSDRRVSRTHTEETTTSGSGVAQGEVRFFRYTDQGSGKTTCHIEADVEKEVAKIPEVGRRWDSKGEQPVKQEYSLLAGSVFGTDFSFLSSNLPKKFTRSEHRLSLEPQEVAVSGDNVGRPATHRELKELVIAGVATVADSNINLDPLGCPGKHGEELPRFIFGDVGTEFAPGEHLTKFCHDR